MEPERLESWGAPGVKPRVVDAAAKYLHLRGYSGVNLAELDEAVRLSLGQAHCDPFVDGVPTLAGLFTTKEQIFVEFLKALFEECRKSAFDTLAEQIKQKSGNVDAVQVVLQGGINDALRRFQSFRFLIAGAVAEGFALRRIDPFLFAETRRAAHIFFAGLLGFWRLKNETYAEAEDGPTEWAERVYEEKYDAAVGVLRPQVDIPLDREHMVEGLYLVYGAATLWWLANRSPNTTEPTELAADLTVLVAGGLRSLDARGDSYLRRAVRIEQRLRFIHVSDPLLRLIPKRHLENLWKRLLSVAYGALPGRILMANGLK